MAAPRLGFKAAEICLEARTAEVHVYDVRIVSPAPDLNTELSKTHIETLVIGERYPLCGARCNIVCASRADHRLIDSMQDQFERAGRAPTGGVPIAHAVAPSQRRPASLVCASDALTAPLISQPPAARGP